MPENIVDGFRFSFDVQAGNTPANNATFTSPVAPPPSPTRVFDVPSLEDIPSWASELEPTTYWGLLCSVSFDGVPWAMHGVTNCVHRSWLYLTETCDDARYFAPAVAAKRGGIVTPCPHSLTHFLSVAKSIGCKGVRIFSNLDTEDVPIL